MSIPYQADQDIGIDLTGKFEVKTKDKTFTTSIYPFLQTDHLADQLKGNPKYSGFCPRTNEIRW